MPRPPLFPATLAGEASAVRLAMEFDAEPLAAELRSLEQQPWRHQRPYSAGQVGKPIAQGWTCFPLHSPGGLLERTDPGGPALVPFADTPALSALPAMAKVLRELPCELRSARLLALDAGAELAEHRDEFIGFGYGQLRLHIPIVTNPGARLFIEGYEHNWKSGELWYANFALPHFLRNDGAERRVHLVVDCMLNDALLALFPDWFRERVNALDYVSNQPRTAPAPLPALPEFLLPAPLDTDLLAHLPETGHDNGTGHDGGPQPTVGVTDSTGEPVGRVPAWLERKPEGLVLRTAGGAQAALVPIGAYEYRFEGWTDERTIDLGQLPDRVVLHDRRNWWHRTWSCPVRCTA
ncbi:aspartyl/asparaginyl beta-hydroxylase domain-containing protein [Micromonospora sp. NPDC003197]